MAMHPPPGFVQIPGSHHGGWHKIENGRVVARWYPSPSHAFAHASHLLTRGAGVDMETLANPPEDEEEEPMSKAVRAMNDIRRRIEALSKGRVRAHERHLPGGKVVQVSAHDTRRTPTFKDHRGKSDVAQAIHEHLARHGPSHIDVVHAHVRRETGRDVSRSELDAATDELGVQGIAGGRRPYVHVRSKEGKHGTRLSLHPAHPDEKARRARERVEGPPRREAKAKQAAAYRKERQTRMDADRTKRTKSREEAPARRQAAIDGAVAEGRARGFEPGKRHPSSRKTPAAEPSDLAQHLHRTIEEHGSLDERALHQHVARQRGKAISTGELDAAMGELGRHVVRHMTRNGKVKVKLRKAGGSLDMADLRRRIEDLAIRKLMKGVKKGTKKKGNPEYEQTKGYPKRRLASDRTSRVTVESVAHQIHQTLAKHGPSHPQQVHSDAARNLQEAIPHATLHAAIEHLAGAGTIVRRGTPGERNDRLQLHRSHPDERARVERERVARPARREARARKAEEMKASLARSAAAEQRMREKRQREREERPKRMAAERERDMAAKVARGFTPGRAHPSTRLEPSPNPSDVAQALYQALYSNGNHADEHDHHGLAARVLGRAITQDEYDAAMDELGSKAVRKMTANGKVKVRKRLPQFGRVVAPMSKALAFHADAIRKLMRSMKLAKANGDACAHHGALGMFHAEVAHHMREQARDVRRQAARLHRSQRGPLRQRERSLRTTAMSHELAGDHHQYAAGDHRSNYFGAAKSSETAHLHTRISMGHSTTQEFLASSPRVAHLKNFASTLAKGGRSSLRKAG